jgi:PPP family 3-phenylpropionic acid transporter
MASTRRLALSTRAALRAYYFAVFAALGVYVPFFPPWLEAHGFTGLRLSVIVALGPAMSIVAPPLVGFFADLFGLRGTLLRWASLGVWLAFIFLGFHSLETAEPEFAIVLGCMIVYAFCRAPMGMLADVIALEEGSTYGRLRLWGSLGFMITAAVSGYWITTHGSPSVPLSIAALLTLAAVASFVLPPRANLPPGPLVEEMKRLWDHHGFRWFLLASFFSTVSHAAYDVCSSLYFRDLGADSPFIGRAWATGTLAEIVMMAFGAGLFLRYSARRLRGIAFATTAVRWLLMASIHSLPILLMLQPLHAISFGLMWISSMALVRDFSTPGSMATAQGLFASASALGGVLGTLVWGTLYRWGGGSLVFGGAALAALCALGFNLLTFLPVPRPSDELV